MSAPVVALAVSGHGFGHAVRSAEVASALIALGCRMLVRTDAPAWLFPPEVELIPSPGWPLDVGVAQYDGLDLDIDATRARCAAFAARFDARADAEAEVLVASGADVLLADIPPLALAAAARAGIPSVAMSNFGWDWIYAAWPDFDLAVAAVRAGYQHADLLLRLPLHSDAADAFVAFKHIEDVPLIARRARRSRCDMRAEIGLPQAARVVLLSFGGFAALGLDLAALGEWTDYVFVLTPPTTPSGEVPSNVVVQQPAPRDYVSLVAACDVVVTKPGYGIVADCLANGVAVLYTDRGPFREYEVLARALPSLCRARYVPRAEVLAGHLGPHLDAVLELPRLRFEQRLDGAQHVAARLLEVAGVRSVSGFSERPD